MLNVRKYKMNFDFTTSILNHCKIVIRKSCKSDTSTVGILMTGEISPKTSFFTKFLTEVEMTVPSTIQF